MNMRSMFAADLPRKKPITIIIARQDVACNSLYAVCGGGPGAETKLRLQKAFEAF